MTNYQVHVTIENKPGISDPEGKTILNDLVLKGTHQNVSEIKTAKMLNNNIRRLVVLENENLAGVITQTDLTEFLRSKILINANVENIETD